MTIYKLSGVLNPKHRYTCNSRALALALVLVSYSAHDPNTVALVSGVSMETDLICEDLWQGEDQIQQKLTILPLKLAS